MNIYIYIYINNIYSTRARPVSAARKRTCWAKPLATSSIGGFWGTPNLPTNIIPAKIAWLKLSGKFPMGLEIPPLKTKIMLESNPLKSTMLVGKSPGPGNVGTSLLSGESLPSEARAGLGRTLTLPNPYFADGINSLILSILAGPALVTTT